MKLHRNPSINVDARVPVKFFLKNSHNDLDLEHRILKVKLARYIIILNICVKLFQNPPINVGDKAMQKVNIRTYGTNPISLATSLREGIII